MAAEESVVKYVACIAHDRMKESMVSFVARHRDVFRRLNLIATGTTGKLISDHVGLPVLCMKSGPHGGDLQIGSKISCGKVSAVFFFRDPLLAHAHEPDINAFARICDVHDVPVATNLATAELLVAGLAKETRRPRPIVSHPETSAPLITPPIPAAMLRISGAKRGGITRDATS